MLVKFLQATFSIALFLYCFMPQAVLAKCDGDVRVFGESICFREPNLLWETTKKLPDEVPSKTSTRYSYLLKRYNAVGHDGEANLHVLNIPAPSEKIENLEEYLISTSNSGLSKDIWRSLPKNSDYREAMLSKNKPNRPVTDLNHFSLVASETAITGQVGKDGYVTETVLVSVGKSILEFYVTATFRDWDIEKATINAKEVAYSVLEMLFECNPGKSKWERNEQKTILTNLSEKLEFIRNCKTPPIIEERIVSPAPAAHERRVVQMHIGNLLSEYRWLILALALFFIVLIAIRFYQKAKVTAQIADNEEWDFFFEEETTSFETRDEEPAFSREECLAQLELDTDASFEAIKHRYRIMVQILHPDRLTATGEARELALEKFRKVNQAYAILKKQCEQ